MARASIAIMNRQGKDLNFPIFGAISRTKCAKKGNFGQETLDTTASLLGESRALPAAAYLEKLETDAASGLDRLSRHPRCDRGGHINMALSRYTRKKRKDSKKLRDMEPHKFVECRRLRTDPTVVLTGARETILSFPPITNEWDYVKPSHLLSYDKDSGDSATLSQAAW